MGLTGRRPRGLPCTISGYKRGPFSFTRYHEMRAF